MTGPPAETRRVIKSHSLSEIARPLIEAERQAFEAFKVHMREHVIPAIVDKVKARRRAAAVSRGRHVPLYGSAP